MLELLLAVFFKWRKMEYIYAVMLLNKAGKEANVENVTAVLKAAGVEADAAKVKSLIAALEGVDIEKVISEAAVAPISGGAAPAGTGAAAAPAEKKEEKKKEAQPAVDAAAGLGSLF